MEIFDLFFENLGQAWGHIYLSDSNYLTLFVVNNDELNQQTMALDSVKRHLYSILNY